MIKQPFNNESPTNDLEEKVLSNLENKKIQEFKFDREQAYYSFKGEKVTNLGNVFSQWYKDTRREIWRDPTYESWQPRIQIKTEQTTKADNTQYAEIFFNNKNARAIIDDAFESDQLDDLLDKIGQASIECHVARLLTHVNAPACEDLAIAMLNEGTFIPHSVDGKAGMQFWTFTPYIYEALRINGLSDEGAFKSLLVWSSHRNTTKHDWGQEVNAEYLGIKNLGFIIDEGAYLTYDGFDQSHQLAWEVGKHIAKELLA